METIINYAGLTLAILVVIYFIPPFSEIVRPIYAGVGQVFVWLAKELFSWCIFLIKKIINSHTTLFNNLITPKHKIDPELMVERIKNKKKT